RLLVADEPAPAGRAVDVQGLLDGLVLPLLLLLGAGERAAGGAHQLQEVVGGDDVAHRAVEDVVEPPLGPFLVLDRVVEAQRVGDPPAREGVDEDELRVLDRDALRLAVPGDDAGDEADDVVEKGELPVEAGPDDRLADRLAETDDEGRLTLADDEGRAGGEEGDDDRHHPRSPAGHGFSPGFLGSGLSRPVPVKTGSRPFKPPSTTKRRPAPGSACCIASRERRSRGATGAFLYSARS